MSRRPTERGVALVTTLIMLSLVTFMSVAYLALTRREKDSARTSQQLSDAKTMAAAGQERAISHIGNLLLAARNPHLLDFAVSTNYQNAAGFTANTTNAANVNYNYSTGLPLSQPDQQLNIFNLLYDPRAPVYVNTNAGNATGPLEFRYYVDLNRNAVFEDSGLLSERDNLNNNLGNRLFVGDPQWVGMLERPEFHHSGTNLFLGRYAWIALPVSKSLDLNWIHNQSKNSLPLNLWPASFEGYSRNHGMLPAELNLASLLVALNTNAWPLTSYGYNPALNLSSAGNAFADALFLSAYRYDSNYVNLSNVFTLYGLVGGNRIGTDLTDGYADGPLMTGISLPNVLAGDDTTNAPWFGAPKSRPYFDSVSELFNASRVYAPFVNRMTGVMNNFGHHDRYTAYRLLSQVNSDSIAETTTGQIHLNYNNLTWARFDAGANVDGSTETITVPGFVLHNGQLIAFTEELQTGGAVSASGALPVGISRQSLYRVRNRVLTPNGVTFQISRVGTNIVDLTAGTAGTYTYVYSLTAPFDANRQTDFIPWEPVQFFGAVANTLLKQFHGLGLDGQGPHIQLYPTNQYSADVHRTLQLAANIYESTRGARYPAWDSTSNYNAGDRVLASGIAYQAAAANTGSAPGANPGNWTYLPVYPAVFRPSFANIGGEIYITGYTEETNAVFIANPFIDLKDVTQHALVTSNPDWNIYGVPVVMAARKGLPSFNEFTLETVAQLTRKLEFTKNTNVTPNVFTTNQMLILGITNIIGIEGWNSYLQTYPSNLNLYVTNIYSAAIATNLLQSNIYVMAPRVNVLVPGTNIGAWPANNHKLYAAVQGVLTNATYVHGAPGPYFTNTTGPAFYERPSQFPVPSWYLNVSNRFVYAAVEGASLATGRVIDFVNLDDLYLNLDLTEALLNDNASAAGLPNMWLTNRSNPADITIAPQGVTNQILVSLGQPRLSQVLWQRWSAVLGPTGVDYEISKFRRFLNLTALPGYQQQRFPPTTNAAAPFAPTRKFYHLFRWAANDPMVHYTRDDLAVTHFKNGTLFYTPAMLASNLPSGLSYSNFSRANFYKPVEYRETPYSPWGGKRNPATLLSAYDQGVTNASAPAAIDYDLSVKDPLVRRSDDWDFPNGQIGNAGWLGRVHRGTPWQTIYFKGVADRASWTNWMGNGRPLSHPSNDWFLANLFTIAPDANARRSLVSVNQTNEAVWAALLGGVLTLSNSVDYTFSPPNTPAAYNDLAITPDTTQFRTIHNAVLTARNNLTNQFPPQVFTNVGQILAVPELSVGPIIGATRSSEVVPSPFLNIGFPVFPDEWSSEQKYGLHDAAYERIPQQILSLLTVEDYPRAAIYAFGQALEPAPRSRLLTPGPFYRLTTNYAIKGEMVSKSLVRFEGINPVLRYNTTNDVSVANDTISLNRIAFRLEHVQRNWGNIAHTPVMLRPVPETGITPALPSPLVAGRTYYIANHGVDFITLSATPGGAVIDLLDTGVGLNDITTVPRTIVEKYNVLQPE
jgi:hypothetical protein